MRELVARFLSQSISRRTFLKGLTTAGVSLTAAKDIVEALVPTAHAQAASSGAFKLVEGTGAECFAEQLIASGVKYVFGNSASEDAHFYEALVDRPQLKYILTPHEGPGAAMAAGYVKASGEPTIVMQAAVVGLANAMGQMFNAYKEQTPLVFYSYRTDQSGRAGRDGFEEVANQEQIVQPMTKYAWLARRADMIPETVRRAFKAAWTPPYGPTYASWHSDYNDERVRAEVISHEKLDPRMRVRPNPAEVDRAAKMLLEARMPLMIVGDEVYNAKAIGKAVRLAELLGMPVTQARQIYANFPETHPLWVGNPPAADVARLPEESRCGDQRRQQAPAQQRRADGRARSEVHRHAHRQREHGEHHRARRTAGGRCGLWARRPDRGGVAAHDAGVQAEGRRTGGRGAQFPRARPGAARSGDEEPGLEPRADARRPRDARGGTVRRSRRDHRARGGLGGAARLRLQSAERP
jgi:hypothetical protein